MNDRSSRLMRALCAIIASACIVGCARDEPPASDAVTGAEPAASGAERDAEPASATGGEALVSRGVDDDASPAGAPDFGAVKPAAEYFDDPELAGADLERGKLLSLACAACHTFGVGERTIIGPNLHGVFGRRAASLPDFAYSSALLASGLYWTPRSLAAWLADPQGFVSGTTMTFTGYHSADDRRDLIAYLLRATE
jgi:cytochrome c